MHPPPTKEALAMAPWMRFARAEEGVAEVPGVGNSARVLTYLRSCEGARRMLQLDSTAWCSAFANWCMQQAHIASTRSLAARSWLRYGDEIPRAQVRYGDVAVLWRGAPIPKTVLNAPGHVGFVDRIVGEQVLIHGGNQGDKVSVAPYPMRRVLAFRRPTVGELELHRLMSRGR